MFIDVKRHCSQKEKEKQIKRGENVVVVRGASIIIIILIGGQFYQF
jgi:hypothetical protein